jgi:hypothetical protein
MTIAIIIINALAILAYGYKTYQLSGELEVIKERLTTIAMDMTKEQLEKYSLEVHYMED